MNSRNPDKPKTPGILHGARVLALLSLTWSGYAITDLMHSGIFGLSVAIAGDIGWLTVLWAEWRGITIAGYRWPAPLAGWLIAAGVSVLLVLHGAEHSRGQAIAGPFVVLVGKVVWVFALAAMRDPAAPTPEQQAEIYTVMRDSAHASALMHARAQARIDRIRAEASVTLARDETDFAITLERLEKQAELHRRTPIALPPSTASSLPEQRPTGPGFDEVAEQAIGVIGEQPSTLASTPNMVAEQIANSAVNRPNSPSVQPNSPAGAPEQPSLADLVREQIANTTNNTDAINGVMAIRPDANRDSVAAAVRRERRKAEKKAGPYL